MFLISLAFVLFVVSLGNEIPRKQICHCPGRDCTKAVLLEIPDTQAEVVGHAAHGDYSPYKFPNPDVANAELVVCLNPCGAIEGDSLCKNGGTCYNSLESNPPYHCDCKPGFIGDNCQINVCDPNPCQHEGTCAPSEDLIYTCQCAEGWKGENCEEIDPCAPNPCQHEGSCHSASSEPFYFCDCVAGWIGDNCEIDDPCDPNPCQHEGTCAPNGNDYACTCPGEYTGQNCDQPISNPCEPNRCIRPDYFSGCARFDCTGTNDCLVVFDDSRCPPPTLPNCQVIRCGPRADLNPGGCFEVNTCTTGICTNQIDPRGSCQEFLK